VAALPDLTLTPRAVPRKLSVSGQRRSRKAQDFMLTISMFYGIMVSKFFQEDEHHGLPHFHVRYAGSKASIAIDDARVFAGQFPPKQLRLVQAWVEIHRDEPLADWELATVGEQPYKIAPLQ